MQSFAAGEGEFEWASADSVASQSRRPRPTRTRGGVVLGNLPWRVAEERSDRIQHISWRPRDTGSDVSPRDSEAMIGFVLESGQSWCTPMLEFEARSRLRLEAVCVGPESDVGIEILRDDGNGANVLFEAPAVTPTRLDADTQIDLALAGGRGRICFRARSGSVGIGEARVVAPELPGSDPRPPWVVLTFVDALRADVLESADARRLVPTIMDLAHQGHWYRRAIAPGCHTRAAVWPILMGRDLMRVDPLRRRVSFPVSAPLEQVYSRGNVFVSHLAEAAGYLSVFLGNNEYLSTIPAFSRFSSQGDASTATFDTVQLLPELMKRYYDERVMLVYYISTPHGQSRVPRRLYEEFGCGELEGTDKTRCQYDARVRHADESFAALQTALSQSGLAARTLQVVTADHGELFGDGFPLEVESVSARSGEFMGWWNAMDQNHGLGCHWNEIHVPLIVAGPNIEPARWPHSVSNLDIVPTLAELMNLPRVSAWDGEVLPLMSGERTPRKGRSFVSYGFCSDSVVSEDRQLIWWLGKCRIRGKEDHRPGESKTEIWDLTSQKRVDRLHHEQLNMAVSRHERWIRSRLSTGAHVFDLSNLPAGELRVQAIEGEIVDYGPSRTVQDLASIFTTGVAEDGRTLTLRFDGFRGLFHVTTDPPFAPITIELELPPGSAEPLTFVGPMQLPLDTIGRTLDPKKDLALYVSQTTPRERKSRQPAIRYWWQPYSQTLDGGKEALANVDFDRVLREWGYIR